MHFKNDNDDGFCGSDDDKTANVNSRIRVDKKKKKINSHRVDDDHRSLPFDKSSS
jgi:hypothetical protein